MAEIYHRPIFGPSGHIIGQKFLRTQKNRDVGHFELLPLYFFEKLKKHFFNFFYLIHIKVFLTRVHVVPIIFYLGEIWEKSQHNYNVKASIHPES